MRWIKPADKMWGGAFDGDRLLRLSSGQHRIVAERRGAPAGAIVAREVLVEGSARVDCSGLMEVKMLDGFVSAGYKVSVEVHGGKVEARTAEVMLVDGRAIGRETSVIYVASNKAVVDAWDDTIVIINPGFRPRVNLHDRAQIVRWQPAPMAKAA